MTYDCMTEEELALWRAGAEQVARQTGYVTKKPCTDCPLAFRLQEYEAGRCSLPYPRTWEQTDERRAYNREWMRRARAVAAQIPTGAQ